MFIIEFIFITYCIFVYLLCSTVFYYKFHLYSYPSLIIDYKYFDDNIINKIQTISAPFIRAIKVESSNYTKIITFKVININKNISEINSIMDYIVCDINEQYIVKTIVTNNINASETIVFYVFMFMSTILILYYRHSLKHISVKAILLYTLLACICSYVLIIYLESSTNIISDHFICNSSQSIHTNILKVIYRGVIIYFASYIL